MDIHLFIRFCEVLPEPTLLLTSDGIIHAANNSVEDRLAISCKSVCNRRIQDLTPKNKHFLDYLRDCSRSTQLLPGTVYLPSSEGDADKYRTEGAAINPATDNNPAVILLRLTSAQTAAEKFIELSTKVDELSNEVRRRKRLEKALQEADKNKNEFMAMLSHELRSPMAPIFNAMHLLNLEENNVENRREAQIVIEREMRHLARLVNDLLEVTRITTGKISLKVELTELNAVAECAIQRQLPQIQMKNQNLVVSLSNTPVMVDADKTRLEQVIDNLLHNATKYNSNGGNIYLSTERKGNLAIIRVKDDGIGMPPELLPNIYNLFTQADKSLDRKDSGLGIGLALVKNLVELHNGTVEAHSDGINRGSEFIVQMPLSQESKFPISIPHHTAMKKNKLRLLVVDDHVNTAKMLMLVLKSWGYEVQMAHNGPDALKLANSFYPHIIFLDIGMPQMDGFETARIIRQMPRLKSSLLVAITGYGHDHDFQNSKAAGFDYHLVKPVEPHDLKKIVEDYSSQDTN